MANTKSGATSSGTLNRKREVHELRRRLKGAERVSAEVDRDLRVSVGRTWETGRRLGLLDLGEALSIERLAERTNRDPKRVVRPVSPPLARVRRAGAPA